MPADDPLPPSRLPTSIAPTEIAYRLLTAAGVRVDWEGLLAVEHLSWADARLPDVAEAHLLDRVLQLVPPALKSAGERIVIVDSGAVGRFGSYRSGIIRLYTPALRLTLPDPEYDRRFSYFTTTVLHETGHAVYARHLSDRDRALVDDLYLERLASTRRAHAGEATQEGAEHHLVDLFVHGLLHISSEPMRNPAARDLLRALGLP